MGPLARLRETWARGREFRRRYGLRATAVRTLNGAWLRRLTFKLKLPKAADGSMVVSPETRPFGVNVLGYLTGAGSLAEVSRSVAHALVAADIPMVLCDHMAPDEPTRIAFERPISTTNPYRVNLLISMPQPATSFGWVLAPDFLVGRYNIGYWPWENDVFPEERRHFQIYDEIWTPSTFVQQAIAKVSPIPVHYVPHPIPPMPGASTRPAVLDGLPTDTCLFLFAFNYSPWTFARKNPDAVIEAFKRAFKPDDNAWLVIKANFGNVHHDRDRLQRMATGANVRFINAYLSRPELEALFGSCDCYVSLHRGEGFGLTMAEAMSLGKPVIATAWSGNMDYTTPENSYLVDYEMRTMGSKDELPEGGGPFHTDWLWAHANVDQAAAYMRQVYEDRDGARRLGEKARADVERLLSPAAVGKVIRQRLLAIGGEA